MHIRSQTPTELVVVASSIWLSAIFAAFAIMPAYITIQIHKPNGFYASGTILLIALVWLRKTTFIFDAQQRVVRWTGRKMLKVSSGTIPFDEVRDIVMDSISSDKGIPIYRLSIVTEQGTIPMEYDYNSGRNMHLQVRDAALDFMGKGVRRQLNSSDPANESTVRRLLEQGREPDAIQHLLSMSNMSLGDATRIVREIEAEQRQRRG